MLYNYKKDKHMRIIYVVDSISNLKQKIDLINSRIPCDMLFVVRADLVSIFETYGLKANAVYYKNLTEVTHHMLLSCTVDDIIIYYSSLNLDSTLLNKFCNAIGDKTKIVTLMPTYNAFESAANVVYNIYVKSLFRAKDSLISAKLQFIPADYSIELIRTHLGNRLFETKPGTAKTIYCENPAQNKSMKSTFKPLKTCLLSLIVSLIITLGLLATIAYWTTHFVVILLFIFMYILDIILTTIFLCKQRFDKRFLGY